MRKIISSLFLIAAFIGSHSKLVAQDNKNVIQNLKDGLAIQGYDPVAYFSQNKAVEGKKTISQKYNGATYYFSSDANKTTFSKDPAKYEPAYGGYCAYAMAFGDQVKIDPETFKVKDGRLLLFYNFRFNNTLTDWNKDEASLFKKAEAEWKKLNDKKN
jgi:YHS domain-containing protein